MRKKLDTRFPAARIKKIMQTDEDVGKIALAVPLLVSKALELFLQDLCDRTYGITLQRGAKTINSLHLKHCVHSFNMFDFLKDTVSKVPELGGSDATSEERSATKRRKVYDVEENGCDEELKRSKKHEAGHSATGSARGRGTGRGRGRPRGSRTRERDATTHGDKDEDNTDMSKPYENNDRCLESLYDKADPEGPATNTSADRSPEPMVRNFDLNVDLNEIGDSTAPSFDPPDEARPVASAPEFKHEEYPGWSLAEMEKMDIDPIQLANLNRAMDDEDDDYDEDG